MLLLVKLLCTCRRVPKSDINGIDGLYREGDAEKSAKKWMMCDPGLNRFLDSFSYVG